MAGTLIVSNLTTDTDNTFIVRSNTGTTLFSANTTGIDVANSIGATAITNDKILSVANTKISGNIISSQITSVANTQITGNITAAQITSVANTQLTGLIQAAQIGSANATLVTSGTLPTARLPAGSVLQVVSVNKVDTFSTATHGSWVNITGMAASITPTSTSSKILVMVQLSIGGGGNNYGRGYGVKRGSTQLNLGTYGTGSPGSFGASTSFSGGDNGGIFSAPFIYLDSPSTTSSTTYQVELFADSRSVTNTLINRTYAGTNDGGYGASTITLMEIAA